MDVSLDVIQIYFDTATYDEIEKDVKVISQSFWNDQFPHIPWHLKKGVSEIKDKLGLDQNILRAARNLCVS